MLAANGDTETTADTALKAIAAYFAARQADKVFTVNLQRAQIGLPPIDVETVAPTMRVIATTDEATRTGLFIGGAVLLGIIALGTIRKTRKG